MLRVCSAVKAADGGTPLTRATQLVQKCFISAPHGFELTALHECLEAHGIQPLVPQDLAAGSDWVSALRCVLEESDLVIGVLPERFETRNVVFELGLACALGRKILLISPSRTDWLPSAHRQVLTVRSTVDNRAAIDFALTQLLRAPTEPPSPRPRHRIQSPPLGPEADVLIERLKGWQTTKEPRIIEGIVSDALSSAGLNAIVESADKQYGADFAVWSDALQPYIDNPLLVEVKVRIGSYSSAQSVVRRLASILGDSRTRWALLIYADGPNLADTGWGSLPQGILVIPVAQLLERLRVHSLPEVIRDLRNERVHGIGA